MFIYLNTLEKIKPKNAITTLPENRRSVSVVKMYVSLNIMYIVDGTHSLLLLSVIALAGKCLPSNTNIGFRFFESSMFIYFRQYFMCLKKKENFE